MELCWSIKIKKLEFVYFLKSYRWRQLERCSEFDIISKTIDYAILYFYTSWVHQTLASTLTYIHPTDYSQFLFSHCLPPKGGEFYQDGDENILYMTNLRILDVINFFFYTCSFTFLSEILPNQQTYIPLLPGLSKTFPSSDRHDS